MLRQAREKEFVLLDQRQSDKICYEDYLYILEHPEEWTFKKFLETYNNSWDYFQKGTGVDEIEDRMRSKKAYYLIDTSKDVHLEEDVEVSSDEDYSSPPEDLIEEWEDSGDEF